MYKVLAMISERNRKKYFSSIFPKVEVTPKKCGFKFLMLGIL